MIKRKSIVSVVLLAVWLAVSSHALAEEFNSSANPASIGVSVPSMIELGSSNPSIYDTDIKVLQIVRGREAAAMLEAADAEIMNLPQGYEYLLAKVKFDLKGRAVSDTMSLALGDTPLQWVALTSELMDYPPVSITVPEPALKGNVKAGESMEGWVAFAVERDDKNPVMVFNPDSGGATGRGRTLFFKLF